MQNSLHPFYIPVLLHPLSSTAHTTLATELWNQGLEKSAKHELELAEEFFIPAKTGVLGVTTAPKDLLTQWESEPSKKKALYVFWQQVIGNKPDYRDAYLQAGSLAYQLLNNKESLNYLEKAHVLDPNSHAINQLLGTIPRK